MLIVPLVATPSQTLTTTLSGQVCQVNCYQKKFGLFFDLYVGTTLIIGGVLCENLNRIVRSAYLGFSGDFFFFDTQGADDPYWDGLGDRWQLVYATQAELAAAGLAA